MCAPIKLSFPFSERKPLFDALLNVYQKQEKNIKKRLDVREDSAENKVS